MVGNERFKKPVATLKSNLIIVGRRIGLLNMLNAIVPSEFAAINVVLKFRKGMASHCQLTGFHHHMSLHRGDLLSTERVHMPNCLHRMGRTNIMWAHFALLNTNMTKKIIRKDQLDTSEIYSVIKVLFGN